MALLNTRDMIDDHLDLISLPEIALRLNQLIDDPAATANDIANLISQDASLTIRLLKIVNSPFYNFSAQVDTVSKAITIIGTRELRDLVMATTIIQKFNRIPLDLTSPECFWRHNIACATAARTIAQQLKIRNSERLFIAGLLHDIGKMLMYIASPELSKQVIELMSVPAVDVIKLEEIAFGFNHGALGAELIQKWNLPEMLIETTLYHHQPSEAILFPTEVAIIHLANNIANSIEVSFSLDDDIPLEQNVWLMLDSDESVLEELIEKSKLVYQQTSDFLYQKKSA